MTRNDKTTNQGRRPWAALLLLGAALLLPAHRAWAQATRTNPAKPSQASQPSREGEPPREKAPASRPFPRIEVRREIEKMALLVRRALFGEKGEPFPLEGYRASLVIQLHTKKGVYDVEARQEFLAPDCIRTEVKEKGLHILRGFDGRHYWQVSPGGSVKDLRQREYKQDRATVRKEIRLARQVLRLFRVDRLLLELKDPAPPWTETIRVPWKGKLTPRVCLAVEGEISYFPFYRKQDYRGPARIRIWVDRETGEPRKVLVWPTFAHSEAAVYIHGETLVLSDFRPVAGGRLRIPTNFRLKVVSPATGRPTPVLVVDLKSLEVNPSFPKGHFSPEAAREFASKGRSR